MITDPIADMLVHLKNASLAGLSSTTVPFSQFKWRVAEFLKKNGFIVALSRKGRGVRKFMVLTLASEGIKPKVINFKRISKPSRRIYRGASQAGALRDGVGLAVYTTPQGIMAGPEARRSRVGGEFLFTIWH